MTGAAAPTLWLSCHAGYACRHSGACCRAGWPLPVDASTAAGIDAAVAIGRIATVDAGRAWLDASAEAPSGMAGTFRLVDRACVFHVRRDPDASPGAGPGDRHCAIHATLGHDALPASCRHFPRVCLIDDRGVRVTLSHFCPTAVAMLVDDDRPLAIVAGPHAVPGLAVPEGLDARAQLPPRLTDATLADWEGLSRWEAHVVAYLAGRDAAADPPERALLDLRQHADRLAAWTPGRDPLVQAVAALDREPDATPGIETLDDARGPASDRRFHSLEIARSACRAPWSWPAAPPDLAAADAAFVAPAWASWARVVRRYLAAKAFASWMTYRLDAARGLVGWLGLALDVLRVECARVSADAGRPLDRGLLVDALRRADLLLVHYADGATMATSLRRSVSSAWRRL
jgi:hypothetical protein